MEIKVGDSLYDFILFQYEVLKIGRKWIYVKRFANTLKVHKDNLKVQRDEYMGGTQLYRTLDEVKEYLEDIYIRNEVRDFFRSGVDRLSKEDLKEIHLIISKYK